MIKQQSSIERLVRGIEEVYALKQPADIFATDALFDINIPSWRFQLQSLGAFIGWFRHYTRDGYKINIEKVVETGSGFVVELEGEYKDHLGIDLYFRNLLLCKVDQDRVTEVVYYCTGDWDSETRERQVKEASMIQR